MCSNLGSENWITLVLSLMSSYDDTFSDITIERVQICLPRMGNLTTLELQMLLRNSRGN